MNNKKLILKRAIKTAASVAKMRFGFTSPVEAGAVNIVAYHRVVSDIAKAEREAIYGIVISGETFRRHCELLKESFEVVTLEKAAQILEGKYQTEKPVAVITFDDGYLDFYEVAFPILREFDLPATNFLTTSFIGEGKFLAHDRLFWLVKTATENHVSLYDALRETGVENAAQIASANAPEMCDALVHLPVDLRETVIEAVEKTLGDKFVAYPREYAGMSWEQINEMQKTGVDFGFHSVNHAVLPLESDEVFETEIFAGKRELEKRLNHKVVSVAYPNGAYDERVKRAVADAGFTIAVTTERRINLPNRSDALALGRISLCEESTRGIFGVYSPSVARLRFGV